jgi:AcrR family transcriptional regulator
MKLSRKQRELIKQREEILSVAERIFSEKGFYTTKMQDIARTAEYGVGTIYKHFKSKEIIFFTIIRNKFREFINDARKSVERETLPEAKLRSLIVSHLGFFEQNKEIFRLLTAEHVSFEKGLRSKFMKEMKKNFADYFNLFKSIYTEGVQSGVFKVETGDNVFHLCLALIGMLNFTSFYKLNNMPSDSLRDNAPLIFNLFLNGVKRWDRAD